ncbi:hypothetical protein [Winogradskyella vidalii]|uniref:hypothetical protein n=1 Tax=Winogradskyella vidalii TaxID=2615024 RepID=UPI0015CD2F21|nr:hypothetical protein [Winogradskyella vidalii]
MKTKLSKLKTDLQSYAEEANLTELQVIEKLKDYYFNKKVTENLKYYKKGQKKVSEITKDLKISPRKFYAILKQKNIEHSTYKKSDSTQD